ncbi:IclR family transcriptional regulator [Propionibacterium australiense]|uniref:Glycerol operon regulatory protein n=1 Tax=Propionibacterium australiense TaxID=119981 RepID=A0A8B3FN70_9ACTN|nr:IclR family transcriptional regulator [Propionibacterium australiense]RLP11310.1 IclR family transcriptional regulator [Propionibacterium australiense]
MDRALAVLMALGEAGPSGTTLTKLAESSGVNKSTAYRALSTLRGRGFATQDLASGNYALGPAAFLLAEKAMGPDNLARALHPILVAISHEVDELVHLGVPMDGGMLYIDKVEQEHTIRVWSAVGQLIPMATSSLGRAVLAAQNTIDEHLSAYIGQLPEKDAGLDRLTEAVHAARELGYATEWGERQPGVACVGLALLRSKTVVGAISITTLAENMTPERAHELARTARAIAAPLLPEGLSLMAPRHGAGDRATT